MPTTLRNGDILFNDGTTQNTSGIQAPAAGSLYVLFASTFNNSGNGTPYFLQNAAIIGASGVIRTRIRSRGAAGSQYQNATQAVARVYINGVAVGSEVASPGANFNYSAALQQDFSVNAGDVVQIASRGVSNGSTSQALAEMMIQVSNVFQANAVYPTPPQAAAF